jgi:outer membrane receptor protein involved in Fe transport
MNSASPSFLRRRPVRLLCASALTASALFAQQAPAPSTAASVTAPGSTAATSGTKRNTTTNADGTETVQLSPFEVTGEKDKGYLATSTMSGTRLNSNLGDLAASISVVTKQQLEDTASTDINDIFRYEASTEGIYQFTSFTLDRGNVSDDVASNPSGATRMRGLTAANIATNGFSTSLPFDTYNIDSVEISRGPNSSIFGLGNTGGGVNINGSKANLTREISSFGTQADSYDGYRQSFDLNRPLLKGRLAVRVLGLYEEKGYVRKPSSDTTRRLQAAVTARPFNNTTIRASFESYRNFNSRPNSKTPYDGTSEWIASGRPTWDPLTSTVHFGDGRAPIVGLPETSEAALLPYGIASTDTAFTTFPSWYIENGAVQSYSINRMPAATGIGPNSATGAQHLLQSGTFLGRTANANLNPLFSIKSSTDRSVYDWTEINLSAPNYANVKGETSSIELEQIFLRSARQTLALQAGWLYERTGTNSRAFLGNSDGGKAQIYIDVNEKLLDGSVNPYLGRPYVGGSQPAYRKARNNNENYRATLAYQLDLTNEKGWIRWLGLHRFSGYGEYRSIYGGSLGFRDTMSSTEAWMGGTPASRNSASYRAYSRYYIGDAKGGNVDYAPQRLAVTNGSLNLRYFNAVTGQWINEPVDFAEYYYANRLNRRLLSTAGGTWQGFFWKGRIIPTLGERKDNNRTRDGNNAINPTVATNGYYDTSKMNSFGDTDWVQQRPEQKGLTRTAGIVVKATDWISLTYNQSNAFSPGSLAYNVYGQPLADPRGKTKDYGFYFSFFNNRLNLSAKQYETIDIGRGTSEVNTIVQRAIRLDNDGNGTAGDPDLYQFLLAEFGKLNSNLTPAQLDAQILPLMGVDAAYIRSHLNRTHGDDSDAYSRGREFEVTYNPTNNWTMKATAAQARAFNGTMSPNLQTYIDSRLPIWTTVKSPYDGSSFWNGTYRVGNLTPNQWYLQNLLAPTKLSVALQGKARTQTREWRAAFVTNYKFAGFTDYRWLKGLDIGGGARWEDKASIGFYGAPPDSDGIVRSYDPNRPIWDKSRAYFDLMAGYNFRWAGGRIRTRVQLTVKNVTEDGRLQAIAANPDGSPWLFRIVDPRQFILSAKFDL